MIRLKSRSFDRVHTDRHALQAGGLQRGGQPPQQMSVGGQRQVQRLAPQSAEGGELPHQLDQPTAQQRFAAGEADLGDAESDEET